MASRRQAATGNVVARGAFATVQSAATGGYGAIIVNTVTSIGAVLFGMLVVFFWGMMLNGEKIVKVE